MKILIIDDNPLHLKLMHQISTKVKHIQPILAEDALEGYAILRAIPEIKAVVLDQNMPYMSGTAFMQKMKSTKNMADIPVIIASAEENIAEFLQCGASEVLVKPFEFARFTQILENLQLIAAHDRQQTDSP